jgi:hypothetical protein
MSDFLRPRAGLEHESDERGSGACMSSHTETERWEGAPSFWRAVPGLESSLESKKGAGGSGRGVFISLGASLDLKQ